MRLNDRAEAMRRGEMDSAREWAVGQQIGVGTDIGVFRTHWTMFGAAALGRTVRGKAPVVADGFSARYDLDRAKGGVATAWMARDMAARGIVPAALVFDTVNSIVVQGAALAEATILSSFAVDITRAIPNDALGEVNASGPAGPAGPWPAIPGLRWVGQPGRKPAVAVGDGRVAQR